MRHVWIAQLKCPQNHCVLACNGEFETREDAQALAYRLGEAFAGACLAGALKHECVICKSADLHVQVSPTKFRTMEEAREPLAELEREQAETRRFLLGGRN
jgi:hypothetical protein